ncbi:MAG: GNAT family N-acetyltransferase [Jiangellaceae bacterium]
MHICKDGRAARPGAPERLASGGSAGTFDARRQADDAATSSGVRVRELHTAQDCRALVEVFNRIWSAPTDADLIEMGVLVALAHAGNYVTLAERDGVPVGGAVGFFGPAGRPFHSHIVGVLSPVAGRGVGRAIKLHQRAWCLDRGTTRMTWTYDPLVARNAYFNVRTLGAVPTVYHHDFYGPMSDGINAGQLTDRMVIDWNLVRSGRHQPDGRPDGAVPAERTSAHVAVANDGDRPGPWTPPPPSHRGPVLVGIPRDVEALRRDTGDVAMRWRETTRTAFTDLLGGGWRIMDYLPSGHYVLRRSHPS